jgi:hypothetical protein
MRDIDGPAIMMIAQFLLASGRLPRGRRGLRGLSGSPGFPGAPGRDGYVGRDGHDGRDGVDGTPGRDGVAGRDGVDGQDGTEGSTGAAGPPGPSWPDVFVVHPRAVAPLYWTIQAAIDAAVASGERTELDPAVVLVLPGQYAENIRLHKHVAVWGFDRLGDFSTVLRGQVTCDLILEGGVREKTFTTWAGVSIFPPIGASAGILFTGNNSQKLIIHDTAIEGSAPGLVVDNSYVNGTGTSQVLITDSRVRGLSASSPALRVDAGSVECFRCDIWNRQPVAAASSPVVVVVGPSGGRAQVAQLALSDCNLEGIVTLDGRLSTAVTAGAVFLSLLRCTHKIQFVAASPVNFIATYSAPPAGIVTAALLLSVFSSSAWVANRPIVFGNPGTSVRVGSKLNTFTDPAGLAAVLTGGTATNIPMIAV